jgi:hypothetical protein
MKTPLELYIQTTLKTTNPLSLKRIFLSKAVALIEAKLNSPCCDGNDSIDLLTSADNFFTNTIKQLLETFPKNGNTKALNRAKKLINHRIGTPCCI